jgi:hypothetical protein
MRADAREHACMPPADAPSDAPDAPSDAVGCELESCDVRVRSEFPARVRLHLMRADGRILEVAMSPMMAHKISNDLLRAAAHATAKKPGVV